MIPAVIVPYRDRAMHLAKFIPAINNCLPEAKVYVIEQNGKQPFNRGKILNVGFLEVEKEADYFIMHDVDMLPVKGLVDYSYPEKPTHIATQCSQFDYKMPFDRYFGGCNIFTAKQFRAANGFVNTIYSWGVEDCLLLKSFDERKVDIQRRQCRFECLDHSRFIDPVLYRRNLMKMKYPRDFNDGLTSCNYRVVSREEKGGYTLIKVNI